MVGRLVRRAHGGGLICARSQEELVSHSCYVHGCTMGAQTEEKDKQAVYIVCVHIVEWGGLC